LWTTQTTLDIIVHNGSCFFLALDGHLYLITAAHVYTGFLKAKEKFGDRIACRVGHIPFDPKVHLRDHDKHKDIAIFNYTYEELAKIDGKRALAPARWPPPEPICGLPVFLGALCQINLSQSKKPEAGRAITPPRLRSAIRSPPRSEGPQRRSRHEMALKVEGVVNSGMHTEEALSGSSRFEPLHLVLSSPYRLMRVLCPIVAPKPLFVPTAQS
jgi:hypothetical protein